MIQKKKLVGGQQKSPFAGQNLIFIFSNRFLSFNQKIHFPRQ